jgi:acetyltransferase-like isoleucine patch superfamily enzyme
MKTTLTYRFIRLLGIYLSPEKYGQFSLTGFIGKALRLWKNEILHKMARSWVVLIPAPLAGRMIRAQLHRWRGVKVGKNVFIGIEVMFDSVYPERIHIGNGCIITNNVQLLAHNRDLSDYGPGKTIKDLGYIIEDVVIEDDVVIGIGSTILPGVTIGKGAVIAAGSIVNKDIPPYSMAVGMPAKVIKTFSSESND